MLYGSFIVALSLANVIARAHAGSVRSHLSTGAGRGSLEVSWQSLSVGANLRDIFLNLFLNFNFLILERLRGREETGRKRDRQTDRQTNTSTCCSTQPYTYWLILVCALTRDQTHNTGVLRCCSDQHPKDPCKYVWGGGS